MQSTAEVIWQGREEPLVFLESLKEAHLFFLEGMKNGLFPFVVFVQLVLKLDNITYIVKFPCLPQYA